MSFEITVPHSQCASPTDKESLEELERNRWKTEQLLSTESQRIKNIAKILAEKAPTVLDEVDNVFGPHTAHSLKIPGDVVVVTSRNEMIALSALGHMEKHPHTHLAEKIRSLLNEYVDWSDSGRCAPLPDYKIRDMLLSKGPIREMLLSRRPIQEVLLSKGPDNKNIAKILAEKASQVSEEVENVYGPHKLYYITREPNGKIMAQLFSDNSKDKNEEARDLEIQWISHSVLRHIELYGGSLLGRKLRMALNEYFQLKSNYRQNTSVPEETRRKIREALNANREANKTKPSVLADILRNYAPEVLDYLDILYGPSGRPPLVWDERFGLVKWTLEEQIWTKQIASTALEHIKDSAGPTARKLRLLLSQYVRGKDRQLFAEFGISGDGVTLPK